ncbi:hypothetical protein GCM10009755_04160 [Brevibacterium samyangense]|uniref:Uncharacterized protein n=1 Tax=Brevibacterium samyangense TaxID=366888 RepID=A0ABN2T7A7_9MICO
MVRVPRRSVRPPLCEGGDTHLEEPEHPDAHEAPHEIRRSEGRDDPQHLCQHDEDDVPHRDRTVFRSVPRDPHPQEHVSEPHDDVPDDDRDHVDVPVHLTGPRDRVPAVVEGGEHRPDPHREDRDSHHLRERESEDPVEPVVGVEGAAVPREVDPREADGEHRERETARGEQHVTGGEHVRELRGGHTDGDDEGEVVEEFEGRGGAPGFLRVPPGDGTKAVSDGTHAPMPGQKVSPRR